MTICCLLGFLYPSYLETQTPANWEIVFIPPTTTSTFTPTFNFQTFNY